MIKITKLLLTFSFLYLVSFFLVNAIDSNEDGYELGPSEVLEISVHDECRVVTNQGSYTYFVPTKTAAEWNGFMVNPPSDVLVVEEIDECGVCFGDGMFSQELSLEEDWNMSILWSGPNIAAIIALNSLIDNGTFIKAQNVEGEALELQPEFICGIWGLDYPCGWNDNIGLFETGNYYSIKVSTNTVWTYYACDCDGNILDCADECGGSAIQYDCAECGTSACTTEGDPCGGYTNCGSNCGGSEVCGSCPDPTDSNYECDGTTCSVAIDCAGECGGSSAYDECENCDTNPLNDCTQDCADEWGGNAVYDECGVCGGDGSSCGDTQCCSSGPEPGCCRWNDGGYLYQCTPSQNMCDNFGGIYVNEAQCESANVCDTGLPDEGGGNDDHGGDEYAGWCVCKNGGADVSPNLCEPGFVAECENPNNPNTDGNCGCFPFEI